MADEVDLIPKSWLVELVDPAKAEADGHVDGTPWEPIRQYLQPNDEIWLYGTPSGHWENMAGRQGVVIVRNARVVKEFVGIQT
jgi:hypothetical protein